MHAGRPHGRGTTLRAASPRVLVLGRLQCGAARAGVRRGHEECVELAHLARAAQASYFRLDILKTGRFLVKLGKIRFSQRVHKTIKESVRETPISLKGNADPPLRDI